MPWKAYDNSARSYGGGSSGGAWDGQEKKEVPAWLARKMWHEKDELGTC